MNNREQTHSEDDLSDTGEKMEGTQHEITESPNAKPKNVYNFTEEHPLHFTHGTLVKTKIHNVVPNFIGRLLPRCNQGDREQYCLTMLVFFKPWRKGQTLKRSDATWDETF